MTREKIALVLSLLGVLGGGSSGVNHLLQLLGPIVDLGLAVRENDHQPPWNRPPEVADLLCLFQVLGKDRKFPVIVWSKKKITEDLSPSPVCFVAQHEGKVAKLLAIKELSNDALLVAARRVGSPHLVGMKVPPPAGAGNSADNGCWKLSRLQRLQARAIEDKTVFRILALHIVKSSDKRLILLLERLNLAGEPLNLGSELPAAARDGWIHLASLFIASRACGGHCG